MKIAYICLTRDTSFVLNPSRHDGGGCFARYAKQLLNNENDEFWIYAYSETFIGSCAQDNLEKCVFINDEHVKKIKEGARVTDIFPALKDFDILIHNEDYFAFNVSGTKIKQVIWLGYVNQTILPGNHAGFYYHETQNFRYNPQYSSVFKIKIGKYVDPVFTAVKKEDYVFSCTRNDFLMNTIEVVKICNKYKIKGIFAGPICGAQDGGTYDLLDHIDNKNTFYIGAIPEQVKLDLGRRARLYTVIHNWDTIFSLSAIESLACGTPLVARNTGCFRYIIKDGYNGFFYDGSENNFLQIWEKSKNIDQRSCWLTAREYSHEEMVSSFYNAFKRIL